MFSQKSVLLDNNTVAPYFYSFSSCRQPCTNFLDCVFDFSLHIQELVSPNYFIYLPHNLHFLKLV